MCTTVPEDAGIASAQFEEVNALRIAVRSERIIVNVEFKLSPNFFIPKSSLQKRTSNFNLKTFYNSLMK